MLKRTLRENNLSETTALLDQLGDVLGPCEKLAVAFSGGVDSSVVVAAAVRTLGVDNVLAVTAVSETFPKRELTEAQDLARSLAVRHETIETRELDNEEFCANTSNRCYHCKSELWQRVATVAADNGITAVADGVNADDSSDFRPGIRAGDEAGVLHPLAMVGATKGQVRALARELGLDNWDKPAEACLSSRFPYGNRITAEGLRRVEQAEEFLRGIGIRQLRVRDHDGVARIEVPAGNLAELASGTEREEIVRALKGFGFIYVTIDLEGFRSGSMNEVLP